MEWTEIKEAWRLAKTAYPKIEKLLIVPNNGTFDVYDGAEGRKLGSLNESKLTVAAWVGKTICSKKKHKFNPGDRVRIVLDESTEYMECGEVVGRKQHEDKDWFLVLPDGSSNPRWFNGPALRPNMAGMV